MTFSEEFNPTQSEGDFDDLGSSYPTAFGITFTPQITGICLGILGLVGSVYVALNLVKPAYDNYSQLKMTEAEKLGQVQQQESGELSKRMLDAEQKLRESEALRNQVLSLFSSEESLKTLLFDINQLLEKHQVELVSFQPVGTITVVNDGSLGAGANGRLKRQQFDLTVKGNFGATQSLLRDLERLQPLLVIKGLASRLVEDQFVIDIVDLQQEGGETPATDQKEVPSKDLESSFSLDAILPLSPDEVAALNPEEETPGGETPEGE